MFSETQWKRIWNKCRLGTDAQAGWKMLEQKSNNQNIRSWLHKLVAAVLILLLKSAGGKNAEDQLY